MAIRCRDRRLHSRTLQPLAGLALLAFILLMFRRKLVMMRWLLIIRAWVVGIRLWNRFGLPKVTLVTKWYRRYLPEKVTLMLLLTKLFRCRLCIFRFTFGKTWNRTLLVRLMLRNSVVDRVHRNLPTCCWSLLMVITLKLCRMSWNCRFWYYLMVR